MPRGTTYSNNILELLHGVCPSIFAALVGCFEVEFQEEEGNRDENTHATEDNNLNRSH